MNGDKIALFTKLAKCGMLQILPPSDWEFCTLFDPTPQPPLRFRLKYRQIPCVVNNRGSMQVDRTQQRAITRLCIQCGLFLLQHGAESALVEELSTRLGLALGMDSVESAIFECHRPDHH